MRRQNDGWGPCGCKIKVTGGRQVNWRVGGTCASAAATQRWGGWMGPAGTEPANAFGSTNTDTFLGAPLRGVQGAPQAPSAGGPLARSKLAAASLLSWPAHELSGQPVPAPSMPVLPNGCLKSKPPLLPPQAAATSRLRGNMRGSAGSRMAGLGCPEKGASAVHEWPGGGTLLQWPGRVPGDSACCLL